MLLTAISLWQMTGFSLQMGMGPVIISGLLQGFGLGCTFVPLNTMALSTLPRHLLTQGTALRSLMRNLGGSIGISILGRCWPRTRRSCIRGWSSICARTTRWPSAPLLAAPFSLTDPSGIAALNAEVTRQAEMVAYIDDFALMMMIVVASIPLLLLVRRARAAKQSPAAVDAPSLRVERAG